MYSILLAEYFGIDRIAYGGMAIPQFESLVNIT
jgi:hypothetical protein